MPRARVGALDGLDRGKRVVSRRASIRDLRFGRPAGGARRENELVMAMHEPGVGEPAYCVLRCPVLQLADKLVPAPRLPRGERELKDSAVGRPLDLGRVRHGCSAKNAGAVTPRPLANVSISSYVRLPSPASMRPMRRANILRPSDRLLTSERPLGLIPRCSRHWRTACPNAAESRSSLLSVLMLLLPFVSSCFSRTGRPQCGCPRTALVPAAGGWQNVEGCLMSFLSCSSPTEKTH